MYKCIKKKAVKIINSVFKNKLIQKYNNHKIKILFQFIKEIQIIIYYKKILVNKKKSKIKLIMFNINKFLE